MWLSGCVPLSSIPGKTPQLLPVHPAKKVDFSFLPLLSVWSQNINLFVSHETHLTTNKLMCPTELRSIFLSFLNHILCSSLHPIFCFRVEAQNEVGQHIHCYVAALAAHTTFLEQPKSFRPSQWIKEHGERQSLNRNSLRRQNLTRDCHSRQVRHSGWVVHQPCPRQYNY